jgi:hypothetical protein
VIVVVIDPTRNHFRENHHHMNPEQKIGTGAAFGVVVGAAVHNVGVGN